MSIASEELPRVFAYTDGACIGNPGPGGYAAVMTNGTGRRTLRGHQRLTTNNQMELMAVIKAIELMKTEAPLTIVSDSQYVTRGMNEWLPNWKAKSWRTSDRKPVANRDLWERLDTLVAARPHGVVFEWTRGHAGHPQNEEADKSANEEAKAAQAEFGGSR